MEQVTYLGKVNRFSRMKNREIVNNSFVAFCEKRGMPLPVGYRQVTPNPVAGFKSISKYDKVQPVLDVGAWALAGEWTKNHFQAAMSGSRVLSQEVVLVEMDKSTSCGYPWNLKFKDKNDFLADVNARRALEDFWTMLGVPSEEELMVPIWTCTQKCEMRTPEKIADNNLRTFTASPFEHSVNLNRMCLDMNNKFYDSANDVDGFTQTWSVVGASKFVSGWDNLYRRLNRLHHAFELDESAFDASLFAEALMGQMEIRWSFLREEDRTPANRLRLERLYASIIHSVIVLENGELIQKHTGNPSGSSNTIVDNTMVLFRLFAYAWIVLCKQQQRPTTYEEFMQEVEAALCGDDNTFTVSDEVVGWFNPTTIAPVWSGIGVTTKTPCEQPRPLSEVQFLSQGFAYHDELGIWVPVPETEKVFSSLMYGSEVDDVRWHYLRACALRMDSWGNPECRSVIAAYLEYLNSEHRKELVGSVDRPKGAVTMATIMSNWKSDAWMESLYGGRESKERVGGVIHDPSFKNSYQQLQEILQCKTLENIKMPKSAAAKARRAAKRQGKQAAYHAKHKGPKRGPMFKNPQPVHGQKKHKEKSKKGNYLGKNLRGGRTSTTSKKGTIIEEDEYIDDVNGSVLFSCLELPINPGLPNSLPWGSSIAERYEEYDFEYCEVYFTTTVSGFAPNGQQGSVVLSASYDAADPIPVSLRQVEDSDPHTIPTLPSTREIVLALDCARMRKNLGKFVRVGPLAANQDIKTYDSANAYISVSGCANTTKIGELHIRYKCHLRKPVLDVLTEGVGFHAKSLAVVTTPALENWTVASGASSGLDITLFGGTIQFGPDMQGTYFISMALSHTAVSSATAFGGGATSGGGGGVANAISYFPTGLPLSSDNVSYMASLAVPAGSSNVATTVLKTVRVMNSSAGATYAFTFPTITGTVAGDLWIFKVPSSLLGALEHVEEATEIDVLQKENEALNNRLERIEQMLSSAGSVQFAPPRRIKVEEERKHDEEEESPVYVSARNTLKVRP
jgi:hypothetical protein